MIGKRAIISVLFELDFVFIMTSVIGVCSLCLFGGFLCLMFLFSRCKIPSRTENNQKCILFHWLLLFDGFDCDRINNAIYSDEFLRSGFLFEYFWVLGFLDFKLRRLSAEKMQDN